MEIKAVVCPDCGSPSHWQDLDRPERRRCKNCGVEFVIDKVVREVQLAEPEAETETPEPQEEKPTRQKRDDIVLLVISLIFMIGIFGGMIYWIITSVSHEDYYSPSINTLGQFTIPPLQCNNGDPAELEYGFEENPPFLSVFPGMSGKDRWRVTQEQADLIKNNHSNWIKENYYDYKNSYYWLHCVNVKNKPELFLERADSLIPTDGQQVIFKESK